MRVITFILLFISTLAYAQIYRAEDAAKDTDKVRECKKEINTKKAMDLWPKVEKQIKNAVKRGKSQTAFYIDSAIFEAFATLANKFGYGIHFTETTRPNKMYVYILW